MKVYCLTETVERDGVRDFNILQVLPDKEKAIEEMNKCVAEDPYGDFQNKGIEIQTEMCCESKYNEGIYRYVVIEKDLDQTQEEKPWYTEEWYDADLEAALKVNGISITEENVRLLKVWCDGIFDDKSDRNERIADRAWEVLGMQ